MARQKGFVLLSTKETILHGRYRMVPREDSECYRGCINVRGLWLERCGEKAQEQEAERLRRVEIYRRRLWEEGARIFEPGPFVSSTPDWCRNQYARKG